MYCQWRSEPDHDMRVTRLGYVPSTFNRDNIVVCLLNNFSLWVKLRANQNQGTPVSNSSPHLSFIAKLSLKLQANAMKLSGKLQNHSDIQSFLQTKENSKEVMHRS